MSLLNIHRKAYVRSQLVRLHFSLVTLKGTLKGQCQSHSDSEVLYLVKELG